MVVIEKTFLTADEASKAAIENKINEAIAEALENMDVYNQQYVVQIKIVEVDKTIG
jgi:hypothetical protein